MTKQERDTSDIPKGYNPVSSDDAGTRSTQLGRPVAQTSKPKRGSKAKLGEDLPPSRGGTETP